jgi:hypothetical protein
MPRDPSNLRIFTREGATVFCLLSPVKANPPPAAASAPYRYAPESQSYCKFKWSVFVLRGVILVSCLYAVTRMTEALPVALIPKEYLVASMRFDVIHISRLNIASTLHALHA